MQVRLQPDLLAWIDKLRGEQEPPLSRPEAVRQALDALRKMTGGATR